MVKVHIMVQDVSKGRAVQYYDDYSNLPLWYKMGTTLVSIFDPEYMKEMPRILYHGAIRVEDPHEKTDIVYEYNSGGIAAKMDHHEMRANGYHLFEGGSYNVSTEKVMEFLAWMTSSPIQKKYSKAMYNNALHNCLTFLKEACRVLGIPFPEEFEKFSKWLAKHSTMVNITGVRSGSGVSSKS